MMPCTMSDTQVRQRLAHRIDAALPQTQCQRCGYDDCAAYAQAIACEEAPINQCPPGGAQGVARLASITGQMPLPLNPAHGSEAPRTVAVIDEDWCIGCTLCIKACPTDAILGSHKRMHTVVSLHCTGCERCLAVCPVDCIVLRNVSGVETGWAAWSEHLAAHARHRYQARGTRLRTPIPTDTVLCAVGGEATSSVGGVRLVELLGRARERRARGGDLG